MEKNVLSYFVSNHETNPIYLAAKKTLNHDDISHDLQNAVINQIFKDDGKIDLKFPLIIELNIPSVFHKRYQNEISDLPNKLINATIFNNLAKEFNQSKKNNIFNFENTNIYKMFGMFIEKDKFYQELKNGNKTMAHSYKSFISKIKESIFDDHSLPFPYSLKENKVLKDSIAQNLNLSLLNNIASVFKYANINTRNIIFEAFADDIYYLFNDNPNNQNNYKTKLANTLFTVHPNSFQYMKEKHNLHMPRQITIAYLAYNAMELDNDKFKHFASAFYSHNIDSDLIVSFALANYKNKTNPISDKNKEKNFIENMDYFSNFILMEHNTIDNRTQNSTNISKFK